MKKINLFAIALTSLIMTSCSIGLGEALDLRGPTIQILTPTERECVSENFEITGTAYDDTQVATLTVTLDENTWLNQQGEWTFKAKGSDIFVPYQNGTWDTSSETIKWALQNINLPEDGRYQVIASAVDTSGNTSGDSEKRITVILDKKPPVITLSAPNIHHHALDEIKTAFDGKSPDTLQIVNAVITKGFTISGTSNDNNTVKSVSVYVKKVNPVDGSDTDFIVKHLVRRDEITDLPNPIEKDSLRSWSIDITDEELSALGEGQNYLKICTECSDTAGNKDLSVTEHGYIMYWKEADKPWITINTNSTETQPDEVHAGSSLFGNAFDNNQIEKVLMTLTKKNGTTWETVEGYTNKELYKYDSSKDEPNQTVSFEVTYPSDVAVYKFQVTAYDDNGTNTETITGYVSVLDKYAPSITFQQDSNPFGDKNGKITIKTSVYDNTGIKTLKIKHVKTGDEKTAYSDKNNALWTNDSSVFVYSQDKNNFPQPDTIDDNGIKKTGYDIDYEINLFGSDLNVGFGEGKNKLSEQTFIFLAEDNQGNKTISKYVTSADTIAPEITFETIGSFSADKSDAFPVFLQDFKLTGNWSDDSYEVWKSGSTPLKPKFTVKILGKELPANKVSLNDNGTWEATVPLTAIQESGSIVGAMDIEIDITDVGGNAAKIHNAYQIDTNKPRLEYISSTTISGTYGSGEEIIIDFHFNKAIILSGSNKPVITLNNEKTAVLDEAKTDVRKLSFKYTVGADSTNDTDRLSVTSIDLKSCTITDTAGNECTQASINEAIPLVEFNRDICILTSMPTYKSHYWDNSTKKLVIVFNGLVTPAAGEIEISQTGTILAPAILTKDEYNSMAGIQSYYKEGTSGADSSFNPDLTTKYILDYDTNTNNQALVTAYVATGATKKSVNILSESVTYTQDATNNTTTFELYFGDLPCKGVPYSFAIPADLVKNDAAKTNNAVAAMDMQISSGASVSTVTGVEKPVIRIFKPQQEITDCTDTAAGTVNHPLSTKFKIDCRTPGATLTYSYDCLVATSCTVSDAGDSGWKVDQEERYVQFVYNGNTTTNKANQNNGTGKPNIVPVKNDGYSKGTTSYTSNTDIALGKYTNRGQLTDIPYGNGLTYKITVTANNTETTYDVAYRTTLVFGNNYNEKLNGLKSANYGYWPTPARSAIFIRGGENKEGANATSGLPCSWDVNKKNEVVMMKPDGNNFYFTTWNITVDNFYFQPMGGLCDSKTNTEGEGNNQGPARSIYQQDGMIFCLPEYPIGKGEYMIINYDGRYDIGIPAKVMNHR